MQEFLLFLEYESSFIQNNKNSNVYEKIDINSSRLFKRRNQQARHKYLRLNLLGAKAKGPPQLIKSVRFGFLMK